MACLRDIKRITKKKVMALQPIYGVNHGIKIGNTCSPASITIYSGKTLEYLIEHEFFLYDDYAEFTTLEEAIDYVKTLESYDKSKEIFIHECLPWEDYKKQWNIKED